MTATSVPTTRTSDPSAEVTPVEGSSGRLWKAGLVSGCAAAVATTVVAVAAEALDVPLEAAGEPFPIYGFAQLTLFFTAIGVLIAKGIARWSAHPRSTFVRTTVLLTVLSCVPDVLISADTATKVTLIATHLVAAAIVIPALAGRLAEQR
jgi:hypothetical protein